MTELIFIQAYPTRFAAEQAQQILAGHNIRAMVMADDAGGMMGGMSLGRKGVRLLVNPEDVDEARQVLSPGEVVDSTLAADSGAGPESVPAPLAAAEAAARHFDAGHNCAEAVLRALADDLGRPDCVGLATGFGGGMGGDGDVCGALSGAVMAVGLLLGRNEPTDDGRKEHCYEVVRELRERFRQAMGAVDCRELTGVDLTTEAGRAEFEERGVKASVCRQAVREAASLVAEVLARTA